MKDWASLPLRLGLGIMFGGPGIQGFAKNLSGLGFTPAVFWAHLAAYSELIAGLCLIVGVCVRLATIPLIVFIVTAGYKVHLSKGFFLQKGGYEYTFIILCALISLLIAGPGKLSITKKV